MAKRKKTDNQNLKVKLDLRRYFLKRYHSSGPLRVCDACQGEGLLWKTLREEFDVTTYWGLDLKKKKGRMKIDSSRVLAIPGLQSNVIDIDTYGRPWDHWEALLSVMHQPMTVFLTVGGGSVNTGRGIGTGVQSISRAALRAMGIPYEQYKGSLGVAKHMRASQFLPGGLSGKLADISVKWSLGLAYRYGAQIEECLEATTKSKHTRYFGVRLSPQST